MIPLAMTESRGVKHSSYRVLQALHINITRSDDVGKVLSLTKHSSAPRHCERSDAIPHTGKMASAFFLSEAQNAQSVDRN